MLPVVKVLHYISTSYMHGHTKMTGARIVVFPAGRKFYPNCMPHKLYVIGANVDCDLIDLMGVIITNID